MNYLIALFLLFALPMQSMDKGQSKDQPKEEKPKFIVQRGRYDIVEIIDASNKTLIAFYDQDFTPGNWGDKGLRGYGRPEYIWGKFNEPKLYGYQSPKGVDLLAAVKEFINHESRLRLVIGKDGKSYIAQVPEKDEAKK